MIAARLSASVRLAWEVVRSDGSQHGSPAADGGGWSTGGWWGAIDIPPDMLIDSPRHLGNHSGMTVGESPDEHAPEDDTALLAAALNYVWARYDGRTQRAFQMLNYYLVTIAILLTAYTSAINGKHYGIAAALAGTGLVLTAQAIAGLLYELNAAALAERPLIELQDRIVGRLRIDSICMAGRQTGVRARRVTVVIAFGLATLLNIGALLYALFH